MMPDIRHNDLLTLLIWTYTKRRKQNQIFAHLTELEQNTRCAVFYWFYQ